MSTCGTGDFIFLPLLSGLRELMCVATFICDSRRHEPKHLYYHKHMVMQDPGGRMCECFGSVLGVFTSVDVFLEQV